MRVINNLKLINKEVEVKAYDCELWGYQEQKSICVQEVVSQQ